MSEKSTLNDHFELTDKAVNKFQDGVSSTQAGILRTINGALRQLEVKNGNIVPNQKNLRLLRFLQEDIVKIIINPAYKKKLESYLNNFTRIKRLNDNYFTPLLKEFNPNKHVFSEILKGNLELTRDSLSRSGVVNQVVNPVMKLIEQGITTGIAFDDLEEAVKIDIIGNDERLGRFERYTKQISRDALNQYSRNYVSSISSEYGMEWYYYDGSQRPDSRTYCKKRKGKYFHKKEVEKSSREKWSGKIPGTNSTTIFIYCGGYQCVDEYLPVIIDVVPKSVINRNIKNGNYKPKEND